MRFTVHRRGFTLIELLIVIMIIGLLTGLATTSYINAQKTARDNTRKTGVASVSGAVEAYFQTKRVFPGLIGNEAGAVTALELSPTSWQGCLAIDKQTAEAPNYTSILYYSYPTVVGGTGSKAPCNDSTARSSVSNWFVPSQYSPYPNWIPGLGEYLNPAPIETRYQNKNGGSETLDVGGTFTVSTDDVLGTGVAQAFVYRRLVGGYMVYTRLESSSTDIVVNTAMSDEPKYPNNAGVKVYSLGTTSSVFMIRK